jgi:hypothetical protein
MCREACDATNWSSAGNTMGLPGTGTTFTPPFVVAAAAVPVAVAGLALSLYYRCAYTRPQSYRSVTQPSYLPVAQQPSNATVNPFDVSTTP